jgi:AbrB family looped-hinge helix DNA binding protein
MTSTPIRARLRDRGQVTLPAEVRAALGVQEGDEVVFELTAAGVCVRGMRLVPADQAWFWTPEWQEGERQASEDLAAGRYVTYDSAEEFLDALDD